MITIRPLPRHSRHIAHGMLGASLVSAVIGNHLPGPRSIYLSPITTVPPTRLPGRYDYRQGPGYELREDKPIATLQTTSFNQNEEVAIMGEAVVLVR